MVRFRVVLVCVSRSLRKGCTTEGTLSHVYMVNKHRDADTHNSIPLFPRMCCFQSFLCLQAETKTSSHIPIIVVLTTSRKDPLLFLSSKLRQCNILSSSVVSAQTASSSTLDNSSRIPSGKYPSYSSLKQALQQQQASCDPQTALTCRYPKKYVMCKMVVLEEC